MYFSQLMMMYKFNVKILKNRSHNGRKMLLEILVPLLHLDLADMILMDRNKNTVILPLRVVIIIVRILSVFHGYQDFFEIYNNFKLE